MNQFLIGIIIVLSLGTYYLYSQNQVLQANNAQLEGAVATQEEAIATLQSDFAFTNYPITRNDCKESSGSKGTQ